MTLWLAGESLDGPYFAQYLFAGVVFRELQTEALLEKYKSSQRVKVGALFKHPDPYFRLYRMKGTQFWVQLDVNKLMADYNAAVVTKSPKTPSHSPQLGASGVGASAAPSSIAPDADAATAVSSLRATSAPKSNSSSSNTSDHSSSAEVSTSLLDMIAGLKQPQQQGMQELLRVPIATPWSHAAAVAHVLSTQSKRRVSRPGFRGLALHPGCLPGEGSGPIKQVVLGKEAVGSAAAARMIEHLGKVSVIALDCEGGGHMAVAAIMVPAAGKSRYCYNSCVIGTRMCVSFV